MTGTVTDIEGLACGCVVGCRTCNWEVAASNLGRGLLLTKVYSAFHPFRVGKWVPVIAGKSKAGMAHIRLQMNV